MAKLSDQRLVLTSAFGARDPIQTGAGTTPAIHNGADFGPEVRNTQGIRLQSIISGSVTWLDDQYGALGVRTTTTATGSLLQLLRQLYGGVLEGASVSVSLWHLASRVARRGAEVVAGAVLGVMGSTGRSTGVHVHVELRIGGRVVDPKPFIDAQASKAVAPAPGDYQEGVLTMSDVEMLAGKLNHITNLLQPKDAGFGFPEAILNGQRDQTRDLLAEVRAVAKVAAKGAERADLAATLSGAVRDGQLVPSKKWTYDQQILPILQTVLAVLGERQSTAGVQVDVDELAAAIAEGLGDELAETFLDAFAARLSSKQ